MKGLRLGKEKDKRVRLTKNCPGKCILHFPGKDVLDPISAHFFAGAGGKHGTEAAVFGKVLFEGDKLR